MNSKESIREVLTEAMSERGVSNVELAKALGVSKQAVTNWRRGYTSIDIELIRPICDYLNIDINEFFGRSIQKERGLTQAEAELISCYRSADARGKATILDAARRERVFREDDIPGEVGVTA